MFAALLPTTKLRVTGVLLACAPGTCKVTRFKLLPARLPPTLSVKVSSCAPCPSVTVKRAPAIAPKPASTATWTCACVALPAITAVVYVCPSCVRLNR
jgi:hypothetical protein